MKLLQLTPIIFSSLFLFVACEKEDHVSTGEETNTSEHTIQEITRLSDAYCEAQLRVSTNSERGFWGDLWNDVKAVARADYDGAIAGAVAGPGVSAANGGAASANEAIGIVTGRSVAPPTFDPAFPSNPFDHVGIAHVEILSRAIDDLLEVEGAAWPDAFDETTFNHEAFFNYSQDFLVEEGLFTEAELTVLSMEELIAETNLAVGLSHLLMPEAVAEFNSMGYLNETETDILTSYFESFEASTDYASFYDYTIGAETVIIDSELAESSKEIILSVMSTVRHDLNYWNRLE